MFEERNNNFILFNNQNQRISNDCIPITLEIPINTKLSSNKFIFTLLYTNFI